MRPDRLAAERRQACGAAASGPPTGSRPLQADLVDPRPAMEWTTAHLAELAAGHGDLDARSKAKRCGELSLLHAYLRFWVAEDALPAEPFARHLDAWHQTLRQSCEEPLLRQAALAYPPGGLYLAQPYLWLRRSGYRFGRWEDALATLSRSGARPDSVGLVHCLWKAGVLRTLPDWRTALVRWLAAWGEDERSWDHSAYRISHARSTSPTSATRTRRSTKATASVSWHSPSTCSSGGSRVSAGISSASCWSR